MIVTVKESDPLKCGSGVYVQTPEDGSIVAVPLVGRSPQDTRIENHVEIKPTDMLLVPLLVPQGST